jgi:FkbM family methyltransferase
MMNATAPLQRARYDARRVTQTRRTFANWPSLLGRMVGEKVGWRSEDEICFVTRSGARMSCPNIPGARFPVYEQFAEDCYRMDWLLAIDGPFAVLDVGAHVGSFAVNAASSRTDVKVECYEPSPNSAEYLRRNVSQNGLDNQIRVHQCGLAGEAGTSLLDDNGAASAHNGLIRGDDRLVRGEEFLDRRSVTEVTTITFDQALRDAPLPVGVVKMDCEGIEYEVVFNSNPDDWRSVQRVVMEYHPVAGRSWEDLRGWFADAGIDLVEDRKLAPGLGTAWLARKG